MSADAPGPVSDLFARELPRLVAAGAPGPILDLACGRGRHALAAARAGLPVVAMDRNAEFLAELAEHARREGLDVTPLRCDVETPDGIPAPDAAFSAVLTFRFLYRPLAPEIERVLAPGGWLLYETFTRDQRKLGYGPRNPAFLLSPGELPRLFPGLETVAHEELTTGGEKPEAVARLVARKPH